MTDPSPQENLLTDSPARPDHSQPAQAAQPAPIQAGDEGAKVPPAAPVFTTTLPPLDLDGLTKDTVDLAEVDWKRVAPAYLKVRLISRLIWSVLQVGVAALPLIFTTVLGWWDWPTWLVNLLPALAILWNIWLTSLTARQVRALGYSERADHLLVRKGLMFRTVTAVPYGRIQYVDVSSGPIANALNLAELEVKTAASSVTIPGLPKEEAATLRETLTDLSDAKMAGL